MPRRSSEQSDLSGPGITRSAAHLTWRWRIRGGDGKRHSGDTGTNDRAKAIKIAAAKKKEFAGEIAMSRKQAKQDKALGLKSMSFQDACNHFVAYSVLEELREKNLKGQCEWLYDPRGAGIPPNMLCQDIDKAIVTQVKQRRSETLKRAKGGRMVKVSKSTVNGTLRLLQRVLNGAADRHDAKIRRIKWGNFFFEVPKVKKARAISPEVQWRIIDTLGPDYEALVCFAAVVGLRAEECLAGWVQFDEGECMLLDVTGKGHRNDGGRDVPLGEVAMAILLTEYKRKDRHPEAIFTRIAQTTGRIPRTDRTQVKGKRYPMTYACWSSAWDRMRDKLRGKIPGVDIDKVRIHDLRHTAACRALNLGATLSQVQEMLGHSTPVITKLIYAHHDKAAIRSAQDAAGSLAKRPKPTKPKLARVA
jgi:integrase